MMKDVKHGATMAFESQPGHVRPLMKVMLADRTTPGGVAVSWQQIHVYINVVVNIDISQI